MTYNAGDIIIDSSTVDNDTMTITATDDIVNVAGNTATVVGIENVNFNLDAVAAAGDGTATQFDIDADNISSATINVAVTKAGSSVTTALVDNVKDGVTVATALGSLEVDGADDANLTIDLTHATSSKFDQTGTIDDLTITTVGDLIIADGVTANTIVADENITITAGGDVTIASTASLNAGTDGSLNNLVITSGGNVNVGGTSATANKGDVNITANEDITYDGAADDVVTLTSTVDGDIEATANGAKTVTITATGDAGDVADTAPATADGDISVSATSATTVTLTAANDITAATLTAATALTASAGGTISTLTDIENVKALSLASTKSTGSAVVFDGLIGKVEDLRTVEFTGSNDVTLELELADIADSNANLATGVTSIAATDNSTGTSRLSLVDAGAAGEADLDLTGWAVDQIAFNEDLDDGDSFVIASGANLVIATDLAVDLDIDAAATPGNTVTVTFEDDASLTDANELVAGITATDIATMDIVLEDTSMTADLTVDIGAIAIGATNTVNVSGVSNVTIASVDAGTFDASNATGDVTITSANATTSYTTGSGDDTFTAAAAGSINIDGGDGVDTFILTDADYTTAVVGTVVTLDLTNVEVIQANVGGAGQVNASDLTGKSFVINTGVLAVDVQSSTGEVVDLSNIANATMVTVTGLGGADEITGSSTNAMTLDGGAGNDTIIAGVGADIITGGANNDDITAGSGADHVTGGAGADTIKLAGDVVAASDSVVYAASTEGSNVGAAAGTFTGYDVITGFVTTSDKIIGDTNYQDNGAVNAVLFNNKSVVASTDAATDANDLVLADIADVDSIAAFINDSATYAHNGAAEVDVLAITFDSTTALYSVGGNDATIAANEIYLLGTVDAVLVAADIVIA